jgi:hypothetical protein
MIAPLPPLTVNPGRATLSQNGRERVRSLLIAILGVAILSTD